MDAICLGQWDAWPVVARQVTEGCEGICRRQQGVVMTCVKLQDVYPTCPLGVNNLLATGCLLPWGNAVRP